MAEGSAHRLDLRVDPRGDPADEIQDRRILQPVFPVLLDEGVSVEQVSADRGLERDTDVVVGQDVVREAIVDVDGVGRIVEVDTDPVTDEPGRVVARHHALAEVTVGEVTDLGGGLRPRVRSGDQHDRWVVTSS